MPLTTAQIQSRRDAAHAARQQLLQTKRQANGIRRTATAANAPPQRPAEPDGGAQVADAPAADHEAAFSGRMLRSWTRPSPVSSHKRMIAEAQRRHEHCSALALIVIDRCVPYLIDLFRQPHQRPVMIRLTVRSKLTVS